MFNAFSGPVNVHLAQCVRVSLQKRWWHPLLGFGVVLLGAQGAQLGVWAGLGAALLVTAAHVAWIALGSVRRHW